MKIPLLSLIIPYYNSSQFLTDLAKNLKQFSNGCEILFVDDGSEEEEWHKLAKAAKDNNWQAIRNTENHGPGFARNQGIQQATGEYLLFLDADDQLSDDTYQLLKTTITRHTPEVILFDMVGKTKTATISYAMLPNAEMGITNPKLAFAYCRSMTGGKCYLTRFIKSHNIQYGSLKRHEDTAFTKSALALANHVYYLKQPLYIYRLAYSSLVGDDTNASFESSFAAYDLISQHCPDDRKTELCYVYINEVIISCATKIRLLNLSKSDFQGMIDTFNKEFPGWQQNFYLKKASLRYRLIAWLTYRRLYYGLKMFMRLEDFVRRIVGV